MSYTWAVNAFGLYVTSIGSLLIFLYLWRSPRTLEGWAAAGEISSYAKHRRQLIVCMGLLAAWVLLQYAAVIFL